MDTSAQLWDAVPSRQCISLYQYMPGLEIVSLSLLTSLTCDNNTSIPKVIGNVKGCSLVKLSSHPANKIAFP